MIIHTIYDGRIELGFNRDNHRYFWRKADGTSPDVGDKLDTPTLSEEWQRCPGVTDCLSSAASPGLEKWKIRMAVEYLREWVADNSFVDGATEGLIIDEVNFGEACEEALTAHSKISRRGARIGSMAHRWVEKWLLANFGEGDMPKPHTNPEVVNCTDAFQRWISASGVVPLYVERPLFSLSENYAGTIDLIGTDKDGNQVYIDFKTSKGKFDEHHYQLSAYMEAAIQEGLSVLGKRYIVRFPKEGGEVDVYDLDEYGLRSHAEDYKAFLGCLALWHQRQAHLADWRKTQDFTKK